MKSHINIFITKLRKRIEMYSAFLIYRVGGTFYNSIDGIVVFKNSEDMYPCYFFTPLSNEVKEVKTEGLDVLKFFMTPLSNELKEVRFKQNFIFKYKFSEVL